MMNAEKLQYLKELDEGIRMQFLRLKLMKTEIEILTRYSSELEIHIDYLIAQRDELNGASK